MNLKLEKGKFIDVTAVMANYLLRKFIIDVLMPRYGAISNSTTVFVMISNM